MPIENIKIGDLLYVAEITQVRTQEPCPICFGKKEVTLILGNDDRIVMPCEACRVGFYESMGYISSGYYYVADVRIYRVTGIDVRKDEKMFRRTFWCGGVGYHDERVGETQEEALEKAQKWAEETNASLKAELPIKKYRESWSYSRNALYTLQRIEQLEKDLERQRKCLTYYQNKGKT